MKTKSQSKISDHVKWNYPGFVEEAKDNIRYANMLETLVKLGMEIEDIESDLSKIEPIDSEANKVNNIIYTRPIGIIIGHDEKRGGAYSEYLGANEYDYWNKCSAKIKQSLEEYAGIPSIVVTRNQGIAKAYKRIDKDSPLFTCELHFNASVNPAAQGFETLALSSSPNGCFIAKVFNKEFDKQSPIKMRRENADGVKKLFQSNDPNTSRGMYNLSQSKYPSILTEPFFGTNKYDCSNFKLERFVKALAYAYREFNSK